MHNILATGNSSNPWVAIETIKEKNIDGVYIMSIPILDDTIRELSSCFANFEYWARVVGSVSALCEVRITTNWKRLMKILTSFPGVVKLDNIVFHSNILICFFHLKRWKIIYFSLSFVFGCCYFVKILQID
uniref:Uncharacterized protein n=1 Tax=Corethron hystrix TaxID=216773 RepID=A0A7S1BQA0_9STRA